jgi:serine/threonine protein phosphatase PrpC
MYSAEIAEELTLDYASLCRKKASPCASDAYASGFEMLSKLMSEQKQYRSRGRMPRQELSKLLTKEARRLGLSFSSVGVYGFMQKTVFFCDCRSADCRGGAEGLRRLCEQTIGGRMSFPRVVISKGCYALILESLPMYTLEYVKATKPKPGQRTSGDTIGAYNDADGNPCLLLCDGMGSGSRAAIASGLGCSLSECLSGAGATPKLITELLNSALCQRPEEESCSFDLFCFDRYGGSGTFIKSGAAPTLVFRGGTVYKLSAKSLPLGILMNANSEQIRMQMQKNDLVILVSDGIASDFEDTAVLASVISGHEEQSLSLLAERILEECTRNFDVQKDQRKMDDMSVLVVRISETENNLTD